MVIGTLAAIVYHTTIHEMYIRSVSTTGTYLPDYCHGSLYIVRPRVGLALAEGARSVFHHYHSEDLFITGQNKSFKRRFKAIVF